MSLRSFSRATHRKSPWALTRSVRGAPRVGERASRRREEGPRAGGRWCWRLIALFLISKREKDRVAVAVVLVLPGARFSSLPFAPSTRRELDKVLSRRWMPRCLALQGAGGPAKITVRQSIEPPPPAAFFVDRPLFARNPAFPFSLLPLRSSNSSTLARSLPPSSLCLPLISHLSNLKKSK